MDYSPPRILFNAHLETIYPSLFRKVEGVSYERERITTPDKDFIDLDWLRNGNKKLVIISHGLEGNSHRTYVKGMAKAFYQQGYDTLCWNFRGCSEEINQQLRFYHSGATDDLDVVVKHALSVNQYTHIYLIGFSLGGNLTLKFLGEQGDTIYPELKGCVTFSVPLDLHASSIQLSRPSNRIYARRFLKALKNKVVSKSMTRNDIEVKGIEKIRTLQEFDDRFTAPLHGFSDAINYYNQCSAVHFLERITIPTLIVNAANDPFLNEACYPKALLKGHSHVQLEVPEHGGHVGFTLFNQNGLYWSELRAIQFIQSLS